MSAQWASVCVFAAFLCIGYYLLSFLERLLWPRSCPLLSTINCHLPARGPRSRSGIVIICTSARGGPGPASGAPPVSPTRTTSPADTTGSNCCSRPSPTCSASSCAIGSEMIPTELTDATETSAPFDPSCGHSATLPAISRAQPRLQSSWSLWPWRERVPDYYFVLGLSAIAWRPGLECC